MLNIKLAHIVNNRGFIFVFKGDFKRLNSIFHRYLRTLIRAIVIHAGNIFKLRPKNFRSYFKGSLIIIEAVDTPFICTHIGYVYAGKT